MAHPGVPDADRCASQSCNGRGRHGGAARRSWDVLAQTAPGLRPVAWFGPVSAQAKHRGEVAPTARRGHTGRLRRAGAMPLYEPHPLHPCAGRLHLGLARCSRSRLYGGGGTPKSAGASAIRPRHRRAGARCRRHTDGRPGCDGLNSFTDVPVGSATRRAGYLLHGAGRAQVRRRVRRVCQSDVGRATATINVLHQDPGDQVICWWQATIGAAPSAGCSCRGARCAGHSRTPAVLVSAVSRVRSQASGSHGQKPCLATGRQHMLRTGTKR